MMNIQSISIIGAGQLGCRHLQALVKLKGQREIYVFDSSEESISKAKERIGYQAYDGSNHRIKFITTSEQLPLKLDLVIVSTNSDVRREVVYELVNKKNVKYLILEKFLFQAYEDYDDVKSLFEKNNVISWVNCPRRVYGLYNDIKNEIMNTSLHISVEGGNWGLCSNSIHFIDLFAYLTGSSEIELGQANLNSEILESKRVGFLEMTGNISLSNKSGTLTLNANPNSCLPPTISIISSDFRYQIFESQKKILKAYSKNGWNWEEGNINIPYQSNLSNIIVDKLSQKGECELPTYNESINYHKLVLNLFLKNFRANYDKDMQRCPIT